MAVSPFPSTAMRLSPGLWHGDTSRTDIAVPWHLNGPLRIASRKATMESLDLRFGDEDHAVNTTGTAELDSRARPRPPSICGPGRSTSTGCSRIRPSRKRRKVSSKSLAALINESGSRAFSNSAHLGHHGRNRDARRRNPFGRLRRTGLLRRSAALASFEASLPGRSHVHLDGGSNPAARRSSMEGSKPASASSTA